MNVALDPAASVLDTVVMTPAGALTVTPVVIVVTCVTVPFASTTPPSLSVTPSTATPLADVDSEITSAASVLAAAESYFYELFPYKNQIDSFLFRFFVLYDLI
jgi:hypothetical protein